jgi:hypothetical protein
VLTGSREGSDGDDEERKRDPVSGRPPGAQAQGSAAEGLPLDFRLKVLEQVLVHDEHPALVSRAFGMSPSTIRKW